MNHQLTEDAERLQKEIKSLLLDAHEYDKNEPRDISFSKDKQWNTIYAGALLKAKVKELVKKMEIGDVCLYIVVFDNKVTYISFLPGLGLETGNLLRNKAHKERVAANAPRAFIRGSLTRKVIERRTERGVFELYQRYACTQPRCCCHLYYACLKMSWLYLQFPRPIIKVDKIASGSVL